MEIKAGHIFTVEKGNRKMLWKMIEHPYFPGQYSLVREYPGIKSFEQPSDYDHLCGPVTPENAYETAYIQT